MAENDGSVSFYFFDLDDNLFFLPTKLYLWNAEQQLERAISSGEYAANHSRFEGTLTVQEWAVRPEFTYRDFRDAPGVGPNDQQFSKDLLEAVSMPAWQGPSWALLEHAAKNQRPVVFISARGHSPETIEAGFKLLAERGLLAAPLSILATYTCSNPAIRDELGVTDPSMSVAAVKKLAIKAAVEKALEKHGIEPPHRFGMSDDDPNNVVLAINAMRDCKEKYPDKRFFVINTNRDHYVKLEVFPMLHPVTADAQGKTLLSQPENSEVSVQAHTPRLDNQQSKTLPSSKIDGGNFTMLVKNLDTSLEFYSKVLGLEIIKRHGNEFAKVDAGSNFTFVLKLDDAENSAPARFQATINLSCKGNLQEFLDASKVRGLKIDSIISDESGIKTASCADPDGNQIHFFQA